MENMTKDELRELRKQKIASMSHDEVRNLMNQGTERIAQEAHDEFVSRHIEQSKQISRRIKSAVSRQ